MTAIVLACQKRHNRLHLATDAALYRADQSVAAFGSKVWTVAHWPGAVTCLGNAAASPLFGWTLAQEFSSWDDLVDDSEAGLAKLSRVVSEWGLSHAAVLLAGISAKRGPEAYTFQTTTELPAGVTREEAEASPYYQAPYTLTKLSDVIMSPVAPGELSIAAAYEGIDVDADPDVVVWGIRKVLAMQRTMPLPEGIGGIGGWAELTTVSKDSVVQKIIDQWPEDKVGAPLHHGPIDWTEWNRRNPKPGQKLVRLVT